MADKKGHTRLRLQKPWHLSICNKDEDRLVLDKLSAHSTKEYPVPAFVQLKLDGEKLSTSSIGGNGPVDGFITPS